MTYDLWNYVQANPINYVDPSGHEGIGGIGTHGCGLAGLVSPYYVAAHYVNDSVNLSKADWLNTYAAAGIAVQCWAGTIQDIYVREANYSGLGPGQISNTEVATQYAVKIPNRDNPTGNRGFGLRCYLPISYLPTDIQLILAQSCIFCYTPEEIKNIPGFNNLYQLEPLQDQTDINWAVIYMKRRIKSVIDICVRKNCGDTDKLIAAALVQNSPGFTQYHMDHLAKLPKNEQNDKFIMDWETHFQDGASIDTSTQLNRFYQAVQGLKSRNWFAPEIDTDFIEYLINRSWRSPQ